MRKIILSVFFVCVLTSFPVFSYNSGVTYAAIIVAGLNITTLACAIFTKQSYDNHNQLLQKTLLGAAIFHGITGGLILLNKLLCRKQGGCPEILWFSWIPALAGNIVSSMAYGAAKEEPTSKKLQAKLLRATFGLSLASGATNLAMLPILYLLKTLRGSLISS